MATVDVRIVNGEYRPCKQCKWFNVCIVPKGRRHMQLCSINAREYYQCEDYTDKKTTGK